MEKIKNFLQSQKINFRFFTNLERGFETITILENQIIQHNSLNTLFYLTQAEDTEIKIQYNKIIIQKHL